MHQHQCFSSHCLFPSPLTPPPSSLSPLPSKVTPFLLERIRTNTGGMSLAANIRLVMTNAAVGAKVALELANMMKEEPKGQ